MLFYKHDLQTGPFYYNIKALFPEVSLDIHALYESGQIFRIPGTFYHLLNHKTINNTY